jgi:hypothetical protein
MSHITQYGGVFKDGEFMYILHNHDGDLLETQLDVKYLFE